MKCKISGCQNESIVKQMCDKHYRRMRKYGDPHYTQTANGMTRVERCKYELENIEENDNGCWIVRNDLARNRDGYLYVGNTKDKWFLHREILSMKLGRKLQPFPEEVTRHTCHTPDCINPDHLIVGSIKNNADDMIAANRHLTGEKNPTAKITKQIVKKIRKQHKKGVMQRKLAKKYGISQSHVSKIILRKEWKHI